MKILSNILWGAVFIALGVILGGNALGWFNINVFFEGWWTLLIIVPSAITLITKKHRISSLIVLLIGVILLLGCRKILDFEIILKLILPIIIILIGLCIIFKGLIVRKFSKDITELNKKLTKDDEIAVVFSAQNINAAGEEFKGKKLAAIFGGIKLDLTKAKIKEDTIINAAAVFGGIEITTPKDVTVISKSSSFFGGLSNSRKDQPSKKGHTLYIEGACVFGGIEIK